MEMEDNKYKILVVDDEEDICEILQFNLMQAGFTVATAASAEEALYKLKDNYHLILLDIMMDGISGLRMAQMLREDYNNHIPIIFLSALDAEEDILVGFEKGGDDYIPKPFSVKEVLARVQAVLHRCYKNKKSEENTSDSSENNTPGATTKRAISNTAIAKEDGGRMQEKIVVGNLVIDIPDKRVYLSGSEIVLTKKENDILILLTGSQNKIFSREDILKLVWKNESYVLDRTVDVHIARLRKKLGEYGNMIINRSGYGYSFQLQN